MSNRFDLKNSIIGLSVWLFVFTIYWLTKAPTVSFWDCGEFIAASVALGVPHPPGTPLFVLIGRVFSLFPTAVDIGARINILSGISSAFTALFGYLISVRLLRFWFGRNNSSLGEFLIHAGSIAGSLFLAFGLTNWNNSIEAEVYGLSMALFTAIFWLGLIYIDSNDLKFRSRLMLLIFYLAFAGIGVHMTTFLVVPIIALLFIIKRDAPIKLWFLFASFFVLEFYLIFALSSRPGEIPFYMPSALVAIIYLFYVFSFEKMPRVYIYGLLLYVGSVAPLFLLGYEAVTSKQMSLLGHSYAAWISKASLLLLAVYAVYILNRYRSHRDEIDSNANLTTGLFALSTLVAIALLYFPKGYMSFLILSSLLLLALIAILWRYVSWAMLIAIVGSSLVIFGVKEFFIGSVLVAALLVIAGLLFKLPGWKTAVMIILVAMCGYSVHLYIPIRSGLHPSINENNPSQNLTATINYIERKQYGSQSMTERMFVRRGEWSNQFGNHIRMGFWGFFSDQYGLTGPFFIVLFLLGVFGIWEMIRRRPREGLILLLLILIGSVGLVLYMNFADGTRQSPVTGVDYLEVRDRDYFFTPAFVLFGLAIGLGTAILAQFVRESLDKMGGIVKTPILAAVSLLFLLPAFPLAGNYYLCNRTKNFIPYDYAWNLLDSAEKDAVLFTNGDNDTFPVWCLQEAYGIRKDVKVINLSLANTKWYIKQVENDMGVDLGWTDSQIDDLRPFRTQDGTVFRLQDQVVDAAISNNLGRRPINFAITCGSSARTYLGQSADSMLMLRGMAWSVTPQRTGMRIDFEESLDFYLNPDRFAYRGVADTTFYKDATTRRLTGNYVNGIMVVVRALRDAGRNDEAERLAKFGVEAIPFRPELYNLLAEQYASERRTDELVSLMESAPEGNRNRVRLVLAKSLIQDSSYDEAERLLLVVLGEEPKNRQALDELIRFYYDQRRYIEMRAALQRWVQRNPDDAQMIELLKELDKEILRSTGQGRDSL